MDYPEHYTPLAITKADLLAVLQKGLDLSPGASQTKSSQAYEPEVLTSAWVEKTFWKGASDNKDLRTLLIKRGKLLVLRDVFSVFVNRVKTAPGGPDGQVHLAAVTALLSGIKTSVKKIESHISEWRSGVTAPIIFPSQDFLELFPHQRKLFNELSDQVEKKQLFRGDVPGSNHPAKWFITLLVREMRDLEERGIPWFLEHKKGIGFGPGGETILLSGWVSPIAFPREVYDMPTLLGPFKVSIDLLKLFMFFLTGATSWSPPAFAEGLVRIRKGSKTTPHIRASGGLVIHPHVAVDGVLCWGEMKTGANCAIQDMRLADVVEIAGVCLQSADSQMSYSGQWFNAFWRTLPCGICGGTITQARWTGRMKFPPSVKGPLFKWAGAERHDCRGCHSSYCERCAEAGFWDRQPFDSDLRTRPLADGELSYRKSRFCKKCVSSRSSLWTYHRNCDLCGEDGLVWGISKYSPSVSRRQKTSTVGTGIADMKVLASLPPIGDPERPPIEEFFIQMTSPVGNPKNFRYPLIPLLTQCLTNQPSTLKSRFWRTEAHSFGLRLPVSKSAAVTLLICRGCGFLSRVCTNCLVAICCTSYGGLGSCPRCSEKDSWRAFVPFPKFQEVPLNLMRWDGTLFAAPRYDSHAASILKALGKLKSWKGSSSGGGAVEAFMRKSSSSFFPNLRSRGLLDSEQIEACLTAVWAVVQQKCSAWSGNLGSHRLRSKKTRGGRTGTGEVVAPWRTQGTPLSVSYPQDNRVKDDLLESMVEDAIRVIEEVRSSVKQ